MGIVGSLFPLIFHKSTQKQRENAWPEPDMVTLGWAWVGASSVGEAGHRYAVARHAMAFSHLHSDPGRLRLVSL